MLRDLGPIAILRVPAGLRHGGTIERGRSGEEVITRSILIYRSANVLVKKHGQDALIQAAMRADAMLEKGDLDGYAVFKRVVKAVAKLLSN